MTLLLGEASTPLVQLQSSPSRQADQERHIHGFVCMLPAIHMVALLLGAFILGALLAIQANVISGGVQQRTPESNPFQFNNLVLRLPPSKEAGGGPKIAWLMSFPNSGTSYTLALVSSVSNLSMATNYGQEVVEFDQRINLPVIPDTQGPFWLQPLALHPSSVVLTKTHCGGYCHDCHPSESLETPHSFMVQCATARSYYKTEQGEIVSESFIYDYHEQVDRAVHLIRDPLDNMVSRYHLGVQKMQAQNKTELMERYSHDAAGFKAFCADRTFQLDEHSDRHLDQEVMRLIEGVPCHMDLFRYVQWHNLAFITTNDNLNLPTQVLHYEDFSSDLDGTLRELLAFLELPNTGPYVPFDAGRSYREYFSDEQVDRMRNATMMLALPLTWHHLERYF